MGGRKPVGFAVLALAVAACGTARPGGGKGDAAAYLLLGDGLYQTGLAVTRGIAGGYLVAGIRTDSGPAGLVGPHAYLLRLDATGLLEWERVYHEDQAGALRPDAQVRDVATAQDGSGYFVAGWTQGPDDPMPDPWIMKVDAAGLVLAEHVDPGVDPSDPLAGSFSGDFCGLAATADGGVIAVGRVSGGFPHQARVLVARFGPDLSLVWRELLSAEERRTAYGVMVTKEGRIVVGASAFSDGPIDGRLLHLDPDGDLLATHALTSPGDQSLSAIAPSWRESLVPRWGEVGSLFAGSSRGTSVTAHGPVDHADPIVRLVDLEGQEKWQLALPGPGAHREVHGAGRLTNEGAWLVGLAGPGPIAYDAHDAVAWRIGSVGTLLGTANIPAGPYRDALVAVEDDLAVGYRAEAPSGAGMKVLVVLLSPVP